VRKGDKAAPLSKQEASNMVERVRIFADERCKILKADLEDMKIKQQQASESERLMKKKLRELGEGVSKNDILKILDSKVDKD